MNIEMGKILGILCNVLLYWQLCPQFVESNSFRDNGENFRPDLFQAAYNTA